MLIDPSRMAGVKLLVAKYFKVHPEAIQYALRTFPGVEHRLEWVDSINGIEFYNDSKATNVESVGYALASFEDKPIIWIAGGKHKGASYQALKTLVKRHVKTMILIGEAAPIIERELGKLAKVIRAGTLEEAVGNALRAAESGDVILLSPACASFDMFANYEERGNSFKSLVASLH